VESVTRRGQRTRSTGQPGDARLAKPEDAGAGATRNQHESLNGTMHDPMSYQFAVSAAPLPFGVPSVTHLTRLETRTKEFKVYASH